MTQQQHHFSPPAAAKAVRSFWRYPRGGRPGWRAARQRGIVLFFALIVLVIMLIGGIAIVRTTNASLLGAGNLAFRRDLTVQSDAAIARAMAVLATIADKGTSQPTENYSATILPSPTPQGIPAALLLNDDASFSSVGSTTNDMPPPGTANPRGVTIRYLIERMCKNPGGVNAGNCVQMPGGRNNGGSANRLPPPRLQGTVIYRLSARVSGPRDTQAFFQTLFSGPS